ncbi:MAG: RagB/SusD family nutrient uptake outer membrane protein [Mangrovibacterium sp.]
MKRNNKLYIFLTLILLLQGVGCEDFLEETSVSYITADSYIINETGYEDMIKSCYPLLRDIITNYSLVLNGTDIFTKSGYYTAQPGGGGPLELYNVELNSSLGPLESLWTLLYREIGRTNAAIHRAAGITYKDAVKKAARVAEARFLRALSLFWLVQQWGDVPMPLNETVTADKAVVRVPASEVYAQILKDLTEAEADLPVIASDYGRVTKGTAQFLMARVYLTRGWNYNNSLGGSKTDFQNALTYADKIIAAYPLVPKYKNLFPIRSENPLTQYKGTQNAKNSEIVFPVQYSDDVLTYGLETEKEPGNYYHSIFGGYENYPGSLGRTSDYNRTQAMVVTTPAMYRLFDPQKDSRYEHDFVEVIYALKDVLNYNYSLTDPNPKVNYYKGDTVIYFRPWNKSATIEEKGIDVGGTHKYAVLNLDEIDKPGISRISIGTPYMWKFWQPNIQYGDGYGTFDFALFRSAEAYLIAAEAILKGATGGALGGADVYYNKVLDRAVGIGVDPKCAKYPEDVTSFETVSYRATPDNITIDLILDESARELLGEYNRWYDLKRTGKFIERTKRMNPWTRKQGQLDGHHLVRPIPQAEIDRSSPAVSQNLGY